MSLLPPALLLLFSLWAGTFYGGAGFAGATVGTVALLAMVVVGGADADPLRLGRAGRLLPAALWVVVAASAGASSVPRAGLLAVVLLPAYLLLPAALARAWEGEGRRRLGLRGVVVVVGLVALVSLVDRVTGGSPRASEPLGHHNLLALWLVALLPLALVPVRERGPWRWAAAAAGTAALAALAASRSLGGVAALAVVVVLVLCLRRPALRRWWLGGPLVLALLLVVGLAAPRLVAIASGHDPSTAARLTYLRAGWEGWLYRPWIGHGPGSVPWTVAAYLRPLPGINPPGQVLGDLHSLPVELAYELGGTGLLLSLAVAGLFLWRRSRELAVARDPLLLGAALLGLAGAAVALSASAPLAVTALPVALAVVTGAALAAAPASRRETAREGWRRPVAGTYAAVALLVLAPALRAEWHYDRAIARERPSEIRGDLLAAVELDPAFPLYRAWLTWSGGVGQLGRRASATPARQAAAGAPGLGPLWLMAGVYGLEAGEPWAEASLLRAQCLDPLAPLAPFYRMVAISTGPRATAAGTRALLAEPRLAAATWWEGKPELFAAAAAGASSAAGVDAGWRQAFAETAAALPPRSGPVSPLVWGMDESGLSPLSLYAFRRLPRTVRLAPVSVRERLVAAVHLPPASILPSTAAEVFDLPGCRGAAGDPGEAPPF